MIKQVAHEDKPSLFHEFTRITHLRSILKVFCTSPASTAWVDQEDQMVVVIRDNAAFLDCSPTYPRIEQLLDLFPVSCFILPPQDETNGQWGEIFAQHWDKVVPRTRYAFSSHQLSADEIASRQPDLPDRYQVRQLVKADMHYMDKEMSQYVLRTYQNLREFFDEAVAYGVIDTYTNKLVSLCAGYPLIENEDEIDILTRDDDRYRRKGLGTAVALAFMEHSLKAGRTPVWDAANERSRDMALKLGFVDPIPYNAYICFMDQS